ncbi:RAD55 family ATPase [Halobacteriaceae archaeon GCM10025711]
MADRLPTGIDVLDRRLDGGIPEGSVVAFSAPAASQSELILYEMAAARPTLYLTTDRAPQTVEDALEKAHLRTREVVVEQVPGDAPLEHARQQFQRINESSNFIIDPLDNLERTDRNRYQHFLNDLQNHMHNTGSVALLHCLDERPPELRDTTFHMADAVFQLRVNVTAADVESRLAVLKFRGGRALDETIKLDLSDRVRIDTSRDIA